MTPSGPISISKARLLRRRWFQCATLAAASVMLFTFAGGAAGQEPEPAADARPEATPDATINAADSDQGVSRILIPPLYYRTNQGKDHHVIWPLVKISEGRLTRVFPIYASSAPDRHLVFPLFFYAPGQLWIAPTFWRDVSEEGRSVVSLWPIFNHDSEGDFSRRSYLLFFERDKGPDLSAWMIKPFMISIRAGETRFQGIFPYFRNRGPNGRADWLIPLFSRSDRTKRASDGTELRIKRSTLLLSLLYRSTRVETVRGEFLQSSRGSLIFSTARRNDGYRDFRVLGFPLYRHDPESAGDDAEEMGPAQTPQESE